MIINYFSFQVSTKVYISIYKETILPSIALGFFYDIERKYEPILEGTVDGVKVAQLTLKQIAELLSSWNQLVTSCEVYVPKELRYMFPVQTLDELLDLVFQMLSSFRFTNELD